MTVIKPGDQVPYTISTIAYNDVFWFSPVATVPEFKFQMRFKDEIKICPIVVIMA